MQSPAGMRSQSSADPLRESSFGSRLCTGDLDGSSEAGSVRRSYLSSCCRSLEETAGSSHHYYVCMDRNKLLLKTLIAAESAANSTATQLLSFKEILDDEFGDSRSSSERRFSRQKSLLLEKLEVFKQMMSSVHQQLKELQDEETHWIETEKQIEMLHEKLKQSENDNQNLRSSLTEKEKKVEELMVVQKREMDSTASVIQLSKSIEATRAHLQDQLHMKEGENNRQTVQLRALERTIAHQKLEMEELKSQITAVSEVSSQEKEALKKATRAQKHRAERFEAAVERCYEQLREKEVQLDQSRSERNMWQKQQEKITEGKLQLDTQRDSLQNEISVLTAELQRERHTANSATDSLLKKIQKLTSEKEELSRENTFLRDSIADIEQKLQISQAALQEQNVLAKERKCQSEQNQHQVAELKVEITELKIKLESLHQETQDTRDGRDAEITQAREDLERHVQELEVYPELLAAAEQNLQHCQEDLRRSEQRDTDKTEIIRQLQDMVNIQEEKVKSSLEMKTSVDETHSQFQQKVDHLQKKLEEMLSENRELIHRLTAQEEQLHYSSRRLEQRSDECQALKRQLEDALTDVQQQVSKVKEKACVREKDLQVKVMKLEAEKMKREKELKQLRQNKLSSEKQYDVRLRDLQLSLDQSESHKQSIQNYVDFLKNSYATMFEEVLTSTCISSNYLK